MNWFSKWRERRAAVKKSKQYTKLLKKASEVAVKLNEFHAKQPSHFGDLLKGQEAFYENCMPFPDVPDTPLPYAGVDATVCRDCDASLDSCGCDTNYRVLFIDEDGGCVRLDVELTEYGADTIASVFDSFSITARVCEEDGVADTFTEMQGQGEEVF